MTALARTLMIQGTASHVGKSVLVAAFCRLFAREGVRVAPFKAQNMALNSFVTSAGGEIGRSQAFQAQAAGIEPTVHMNPILLKPSSEHDAQVVLLGRPVAPMDVREYHDYQAHAWQAVTESLAFLRETHDVVVIEGAGSPAEINLRERDIVNMRVAALADAPVLLVGDIDRGGVFAALVGTMVLLTPEERARVRGFLINKFRGDVSLLEPGLESLRLHTGVPTLGVIPYLRDLRIDEEDSLAVEGRRQTANPHGGDIDIAVIRLPYISNFTDFDALEQQPGVSVRYISRPGELKQPDLIILPGTKSTVADLDWLRRSGLAERIVSLAGQGTPVIGICGGYQMLGREIADPLRVESAMTRVQGLGLLDVRTVFAPEKTTVQVEGEVAADTPLLPGAKRTPVSGYEIHMGRSEHLGEARPFLRMKRRGTCPVNEPEGAVSADGSVLGTYLHGIFDSEAVRRALLGALGQRRGLEHLSFTPVSYRLAEIDRLADHVASHVDLPAIHRLIGYSNWRS